jgi:hypothetical protein
MQLLMPDLEDDYSLIGIHSTEEDFRLAYLINKHLKSKLTRYKHNLDFKNSDAEFAVFEYKDEINLMNYYLIRNKYVHVVDKQNNEELFSGNFSTTSYLISEKKNIDYFLKIEGGNPRIFLEILVDNLNSIDQVVTSYPIELKTLKSKDYLIF